jgi:hypothetical protein
MDLTMMERVGDRWEKMEGSCSTGQSPQWTVVTMEEEEEEVIPVMASQYSVQRVGLEFLSSRSLPEDGSSVPKHVGFRQLLSIVFY